MGRFGISQIGLLIGAATLLPGCGSVAEQGGGVSRFDRSNFGVPDPAKGGPGGQVYLENCSACHDEGLAGAPQRDMFPFMSPQSIYRALSSGAMRAQGAGLSDAEKTAVAEFLSKRKLSAAAEAPEPPLCKGRARTFDIADRPAFPNWGFGFDNRRFVPTSSAGIDAANVQRLRLKWAMAMPNADQMRSQPATGGGAVFVGSHNGTVYALDRESGCARWLFQAGSEVRTGIVLSDWNERDASARPRVYFGDVTGKVYALDARSGDLIWRISADDSPYATITGAPVLYGNVLYVPVSGLEGIRPVDPKFECCRTRGSVVALNADDGSVKWKTYSTAEPKLLGKNAVGANHYGPAGASIWNSPTIDPVRNLLYVGTGGNSTSPATATSDAIIAMNLTTGKVGWVYQGLAGDASNLSCLYEDKTNCPVENGPDYDFGASAMLVRVGDRDLLIAGQKSGHVHAIDPDNGELVWKVRPGRGGFLGGVHFSLAANQSLVFVPINDAPDKQHNGQPYPIPARPGLYALDLASGSQIWAALSDTSGCKPGERCPVGYSQAITATPDLVFAGNYDGFMRIFSARTGKVLWRYDAKQKVLTTNGIHASGGSFSGGAGPVIYKGMLLLSAGYNRPGLTAGNVLLAFEVR